MMSDISSPLLVFMLILASYGAGSIPFGIVLTKTFTSVNLREIGSGNIGATNVLRTGHKGLAFATLVLDASKGALAVFLLNSFSSAELAAWAGCVAVIGHCFPVWLRFKGGKGVATGMACLAAIDWRLGLICAVIWLVMAGLFRYSSLSALTGFSIALGLCWFSDMLKLPLLQAGAVTFLTMLIILKHHENIRRLMRGQESKISFSKKSAS